MKSVKIRFKNVDDACQNSEVIKNALRDFVRKQICFRIDLEDSEIHYCFGGGNGMVLVAGGKGLETTHREEIEIPKNVRGVDYKELTDEVCRVLIKTETK